MTRRLTICTNHILPPIPLRNCDWSAVTDNYEPGDPVGYGPDEASAVMDLYYQIAEREADITDDLNAEIAQAEIAQEEAGDRDRYEYEMGEA